MRTLQSARKFMLVIKPVRPMQVEQVSFATMKHSLIDIEI